MFSIDEDVLQHIILLFIWLEYLWEQYIAVRQYRKIKANTQVPNELRNVMTKDTFYKARLYSLAKVKFDFLKEAVSIIITTIVIYGGVLALVWDYAHSLHPRMTELLTSCAWLFILSTVSMIVDLPLSIYDTFVLEEKFGFNKQSVGFFIWDNIKKYLLGQVITTIIASILIVTIKNGGQYFFVWLWLVVCIMTIIAITIYPTLIAPLFDKYTPLPEGELRTDIEALAMQLKFPLKRLYVVEGSKRSSHSNAYFYGWFNNKRIVLFDTLIAADDKESGCQKEEILAVLSHELGHWYYNHVLKTTLILQINLFLTFAAFNIMFTYPVLYKCLGFKNVQPVLVGLLALLRYVLVPYNTLLSFGMTCLSRHFEFQADGFAAKLGKSQKLRSALIQLYKDNLGFPIYDYLYSKWHHSHPPLLERLEYLKQVESKLN